MSTINNTPRPVAVPMYIFDLDGTLALIEHRRPLVEKPAGAGPEWKADWDEFHRLCIKDTPNWPVIGLMLQLYGCGCEIRIWSGRVDKVRGATLEWLHVYTGLQPYVLEKMLKMRKGGDYSPDTQMKKKWLNGLPHTERQRLGGVFDDRQSVVDMWRREGLTCFQVAPGNF